MTSIPTTATDESFRERLRRRFKAPRQLSLTRSGKFFLLMTLAVGFGAINTGNNLLFLLFGMMLSLILASGVLSEAVIRHLRLRRRLPRRLEASQPTPGTLRVSNLGWWPSLSIEASERNPRALSGPCTGQTIGSKPIPWWKFWRQQTDDEARPLAAAYCLRAPADGDSDLPTHYELPARGRYALPGLQVSTRFPFGLFEKSRQFDLPAEIVVLPQALPAREWLGKLDARHGETARNQRGRGEDFFGLRDYRAGEDRRSIHWKSTARRGEPVVRETEARERRALAVIFDNRAPSDNPPASVEARFERGIRHLCGLLQSLQSRGYQMQLLTCDGQVDAANADIEPLLRHLAVIDLQPHTAAPPAGEDDQELSPSRVYVGFRGLGGGLSSKPGEDTLRLYLDELAEPDAGDAP